MPCCRKVNKVYILGEYRFILFTISLGVLYSFCYKVEIFTTIWDIVRHTISFYFFFNKTDCERRTLPFPAVVHVIKHLCYFCACFCFQGSRYSIVPCL